MDCKIFNPDKPEEVMVAKKMPDILTIIYQRFNKKTGEKLNHPIEFLHTDDYTSKGEPIYVINNVNYILKGVIAHKGYSRKHGSYKYLTWNSKNQSWNALPPLIGDTLGTYIKYAHVLMFQTTRDDEKEKEDMFAITLEEHRQCELMPPIQQALRLINQSAVCYANAGTNVIFSSPHVTSFMAALPQCGGLLNIMWNLAQAMPKE